MSTADQIVRVLSASLETVTFELKRVTGILEQWQARCAELEAENTRLRDGIMATIDMGNEIERKVPMDELLALLEDDDG